MSHIDDSSDSDDSDLDDLLLDEVPLFRKKEPTRAEKNKEKKLLGFLDECLVETAASADRRTRIASLIQKEEEEIQQRARDQAKSEGEDDEAENGGGERGGEDKENEPEGYGSAAVESKGEKDYATTTMTTKASTASSSKATVSMMTTTTASKPPFSSSSLLLNPDDPEYWARIDRAAKSAEADSSTGGAGGMARRRREMDDALDGLDDVSDHEDGGGSDSGGGTDVDADAAANNRRRRQALANAEVTVRSTNLGIRRTLLGRRRRSDVAEERGDDEVATSTPSAMSSLLPLFGSPSEAMEDLETVLERLDEAADCDEAEPKKKMARRTTTTAAKKKKKGGHKAGTKTKLGATIRRAIDADLFLQFLSWGGMTDLLRNPMATSGDDGVGHESSATALLQRWLWRTACSGGQWKGNLLSEAARRALELAWTHQEGEDDDGMAGGEGRRKIELARLSDMIPALHDGFGVWTGEGPPPPPPDADDEKAEHLDGDRISGLRCHDLEGIKHFFELWSLALDAGLVNWEDEMDDCASTCVVALVRAGLDPAFHGGKDQIEDSLMDLMRSLVKAVSDWLSMKGTDDSSKDLTSWMETTADQVIQACRDLSGGIFKNADEDDDECWLPLSLAVSMFPVLDCERKVLTELAKFKAVLAERALVNCLGKLDDWNERVQAAARFNGGNSNDSADCIITARWRSMAAAEVGLSAVESLGDVITGNHTRFFATVKIAHECSVVGAALFSEVDPSLDGEGGTYGSIKEADAFSRSLDALEILCNRLKKGVSSVFIYPHLRRVKELLTLKSAHYRHLGTEASKMAKRQGIGASVQGSLQGWLGMRNTEDSQDTFEDSQETAY